MNGAIAEQEYRATLFKNQNFVHSINAHDTSSYVLAAFENNNSLRGGVTKISYTTFKYLRFYMFIKNNLDLLCFCKY